MRRTVSYQTIFNAGFDSKLDFNRSLISSNIKWQSKSSGISETKATNNKTSRHPHISTATHSTILADPHSKFCQPLSQWDHCDHFMSRILQLSQTLPERASSLICLQKTLFQKYFLCNEFASKVSHMKKATVGGARFIQALQTRLSTSTLLVLYLC